MFDRLLPFVLPPLVVCAPDPGSAPQQAGAEPAIEHVLVISMDTTRRDRLGFHGGSAKTPSLDELASGGALFESAYTSAPITLPAHATLFTGEFPARHGVRDNAIFLLGEEAITLAELLHGAGFRTAAVVSAFVLDAQFGLDQGFEFYDDRFQTGPGGTLGLDERTADATTDAALRWLGERPEGRFFLFVHYFDPHHPYRAPESFAGEGVHPYDAEIAFMDREIGRLIAGLKAAELLERTLVVITADHGESLGEHGEETHGVFVYQSTMTVPLVFRGPRVTSGARLAGDVSLADVAPTILELLALPIPESVQGRSLASALTGGAALAPLPVQLESWLGRYSFGWSPLSALVDAGHKYVTAPEPELYDLAADPREQHNLLLDQPELAAAWEARASALRARLARADGASAPAHELEPEDRARLESLGYVSAHDDAELGGLDPKRGIQELDQLERAGLAQERGDFAAAVAIYAELLERNPLNRMALERSAIALVGLGRDAEAIERFERVGDDLFPGLPMFHLAQAYARSGNPERALELIAEIRARNKKFSPAHLFQAGYHEAFEEWELAIAAYEELLANWYGSATIRARIEAQIEELRSR